MDQGFPGQHMTTTSVTVNTTTVNPTIRFDKSYFTSLPGILKIVQMTCNLLGFICINVSIYNSLSRAGWFNTVSMIGFWFTGIMLLFYVFHIIEKLHKIPWLKIEFGFCVILTFFNLIAAPLVAAYTSSAESFGAAAFFGFCAMALYGYDALLKYVGIRSGAMAQGERQTSKNISAVTSPAY